MNKTYEDGLEDGRRERDNKQTWVEAWHEGVQKEKVRAARKAYRKSRGSDQLIVGRRAGFVRKSPRESNALVIGIPGKGKTTHMVVPNILEWDGPVFASSSKSDFVNICAGPRLERGKVWILDLRQKEYTLPDAEYVEDQPDGTTVTRHCELIRWSPLRGCKSWETAHTRAVALCAAIKSGGDANSQYWGTRGSQVLGPLLHAAALEDQPMSKALYWLLSKDLKRPEAILRAHGAIEAASALSEIAGGGGDHIGSVIGTATVATAAYTGRVLADADADEFDPESFYEGDAFTILAIAPMDVVTDSGGVLAAIVEQLYSSLKHRFESGRPVAKNVLFAIDEAAACPLKSLPGIMSEGRGLGLRMLICTQSFARLQDRFGDAGAKTIRDSARVTAFFGGCTDDAFLGTMEKLSGQRWVRTPGGKDRSQGSHQPRHTAAALYRIRENKVMVYQGAHPKLMTSAAYWKLYSSRAKTLTEDQRQRDLMMRWTLIGLCVIATIWIFLHGGV